MSADNEKRKEGFWWVRWDGPVGYHDFTRPDDEERHSEWCDNKWRVVEVQRNGHVVGRRYKDALWGPYLGKEPSYGQILELAAVDVNDVSGESDSPLIHALSSATVLGSGWVVVELNDDGSLVMRFVSPDNVTESK